MLAGALVGLAACSSGTSGLTTAALTSKKPADEPVERAIRAARTSAEAQTCGYNFDPAKLRTAYLAFETSQGAEAAARAEKTFDATRAMVSSKIGTAESYCNEDRTAAVKRDLTRFLAGDFALPAAKSEVDIGLFSSGTHGTFDREKIFDAAKRRD